MSGKPCREFERALERLNGRSQATRAMAGLASDRFPARLEGNGTVTSGSETGIDEQHHGIAKKKMYDDAVRIPLTTFSLVEVPLG